MPEKTKKEQEFGDSKPRQSNDPDKAPQNGETVALSQNPDGNVYTVHANDSFGEPYYIWEQTQNDGKNHWFVMERRNEESPEKHPSKTFTTDFTKFDKAEDLTAFLTKDGDIPITARNSLASGSLASAEEYKFTPEDIKHITPIWRTTTEVLNENAFYDSITQKDTYSRLIDAQEGDNTYLGSQLLRQTTEQHSHDADVIVDAKVPEYQNFLEADARRQVSATIEKNGIDDKSLISITQISAEHLYKRDPKKRMLQSLSRSGEEYLESGKPLPPTYGTRLQEISKNHHDKDMSDLLTKASHSWEKTKSQTKTQTRRDEQR